MPTYVASSDAPSIVVVEEAERQLRRAHAWWRENRPAAPTLLVDEFEHACNLLLAAPGAGSSFTRTTRPGVRRLLLKSTQHWLYYVYDPTHSVIYVLAIWSAFRGRNPRLPAAP